MNTTITTPEEEREMLRMIDIEIDDVKTQIKCVRRSLYSCQTYMPSKVIGLKQFTNAEQKEQSDSLERGPKAELKILRRDLKALTHHFHEIWDD